MGSLGTKWSIWDGSSACATLEPVQKASAGSVRSNEPTFVEIEGGPFFANCTFFPAGRLKSLGKVVPTVNPDQISVFLSVLGLFHAPEKCHVTWNFLEARGPSGILGKIGIFGGFSEFSCFGTLFPGKTIPPEWSFGNFGRFWTFFTIT